MAGWLEQAKKRCEEASDCGTPGCTVCIAISDALKALELLERARQLLGQVHELNIKDDYAECKEDYYDELDKPICELLKEVKLMTAEEKAEECVQCPCDEDMLPEDFNRWSRMAQLDYIRQQCKDFYLEGYAAGQPQWTLLGDKLPPDGALCLVHYRDEMECFYDFEILRFRKDGPDWECRKGSMRYAYDDDSYLVLREPPKEG